MSESAIPFPDWKARLQQGERGPKKNLTNLMLHLRGIDGLGNLLRYNELTGTVEWREQPLRDVDMIDIRLRIERENYQPTDKDMPLAIQRVAEDKPYNPVTDYLNSVKWDHKPRIDRWLHKVFGAADTDIVRAFGSMFLISAVARALRPGCKVDTMLILEGEQGIKKSSAVSALFGREFMLNGLRTFHGDEAGIAVQGRWAIDLGELSSMRKADVRDVKHFIALEIDNYRPKYGRNTVNRPRRCVFIGSTNEQGYLRDPSGGRRFWPVACRFVDLSLLQTARDQLWAEAVARFLDGEQWWIDKGTELERLAAAAQAERYTEDIWSADIERYLDSPEVRLRGCVLTSEILHAIGISTVHRDASSEMRVTDHLTFLGWRKKRTERHGLNRNWWFPPGQIE